MSLQSSTVLVVDDEPNVLKSIKRLFFDTDYKIVTADSGESGLAAFEKQAPPVVISDYRMPGMNGVEFLSEVRRRYPNTIRMILSGYADATAIVEAINDGQVYKFIAKPWNDQDLLTTVMRAFEQHKLVQENARLYEQLEQRNSDLEDLTKTLEDQVAVRTRDLEMKNRALHIAQNILNLLPAGVVGIDSEDQLVYANVQAERMIGDDRIALGQSALDVLPSPLRGAMHDAMESSGTMEVDMSIGNNSFKVICTALPRGAGAVGMIVQCKSEELQPSNETDRGETQEGCRTQAQANSSV